jgi:hypothetical protein
MPGKKIKKTGAGNLPKFKEHFANPHVLRGRLPFDSSAYYPYFQKLDSIMMTSLSTCHHSHQACQAVSLIRLPENFN